MSSLVNKIKSLEKNIQKLETMVFNDEVSWESVNLYNWEVGKTVIVSGSKNTKIFEESNIIIFKTTLPPLCVFNEHFHKYFCENNYVISGLYEDADGIHGKGSWVTYKNGQVHKVSNPSSIENLDLVVIFTKSFNEPS